MLSFSQVATKVSHCSCQVNVTTFADVKTAKRSEGNRRLSSNLDSNRSRRSRRAAQVTVKNKLIGVNARSSEVTSNLAANSICQSIAVLSPYISVVSTRDTTRHGSHADGNAAGYIWYQNGVEIPGENQADLTVNFPDYGTYNFAAKAINVEGCVSKVASEPLTVTVTKAPTPCATL